MIRKIDKFLMESRTLRLMFLAFTMIIVYVEFLVPKLDSWWGWVITAAFIYIILGIIWEGGIRGIFIGGEE